MMNSMVSSMMNSMMHSRGMMNSMMNSWGMMERGTMRLNMVMSRGRMMYNMCRGMMNRVVDRVNWVNRDRYSSNFYFNFARSLFYINNFWWLDYSWSRGKVESWKWSGSWDWDRCNWDGCSS